jgi:hypothetical protein
MYNYLDEEYAHEVCEMARNLLWKYGDVAPRVAREWANIKQSQGSPVTAEQWRLVAEAVDELSNAP